MDYKDFKYYHGEAECPFPYDKSRSPYDLLIVKPQVFWWHIEREVEEFAEHWGIKKAMDCYFRKGTEGVPFSEKSLRDSYSSGEAPV